MFRCTNDSQHAYKAPHKRDVGVYMHAMDAAQSSEHKLAFGAESAAVVAHFAGWECFVNTTESVLVPTNNQPSIHTASYLLRGWYPCDLLCWHTRGICNYTEVDAVAQSCACCISCPAWHVAVSGDTK